MKRIAFDGIAHIHAPSFLKMVNEDPDMELCGIFDHDAKRAETSAETFHTKVIPSEEALWNDSSVDAVVLTCETSRHADAIRFVEKSPKPVFIEEPLGFSADDARKMAGSLEKSRTLFQTGYFMRGLPVHQFLKQQIERGAFGKITRIRHTNCHAGSLNGWFDTDWRWMADPAIAGCGAFGDLGTHSLDIIMWLMGRPERVSGTVRTVTGRYGESCDETGEAILEFPGGAIATLAGAWVDTANPVTCEISGTRGHAVIFQGNLYFQSELVPGADGSRPWTDLPEALPHAFLLFLKALKGEKVPLISAREAADRSIVMDAVYRSAKEGKAVNVVY